VAQPTRKAWQGRVQLVRQPLRLLGYVYDWRDAILNERRFHLTETNVADVCSMGKAQKRIADLDLIIILYSAFGDDFNILLKSSEWLVKRRCPIVFFVVNEYDLLREKNMVLSACKANYVCTQLPKATGEFLYGERGHVRVVEMPHALIDYGYHHR
jgi:hypothetical protein